VHKVVQAAVFGNFAISSFLVSWRVRHTWRISCLVILDHRIEALGLGDAILGEGILCMEFFY
jgi:hypothetical protein